MECKYIHITYLPKSANWLLTILSRLISSSSASLKAKHANWSASPLKELGLALSTKFDILSQAVQLTEKDVNKFVQQINKDDLRKCVAQNKAYTFIDKQMPYRIILDLEALIFELRSTYEIVGKFIKLFFEIILDIDMNQSDISDHLKSRSVDLEWIEELRHTRILFFHNSAPWLALHVKSIDPFSCEPVLLKEDMKDFNNVEKIIHFERIAEITNTFFEAMNTIHYWIMKEIEKYETSET